MNAADHPKMMLGDFELMMFSDGTYLLDGGSMFGVVPKSLWNRRVMVDERNLMACGTNCVLVKMGKQNVLIETGIGNKLSEKLKHIYQNKEMLLKNLAEAGVKREDIHAVINSHLHFDHCGWNTMREGESVVPTFPNARYFAPKGEWEHGQLQLERDRISYISDNYDPLLRNGQLTLAEKDSQVLPGISMVHYPGHTRSMMAVVIESGGKTACYISDLIPTSAHLDATWVMSYDLYPLETIENRKRYYSRAIPEKWLTIFTHDHERPWAYLEEPATGKVKASDSPVS